MAILNFPGHGNRPLVFPSPGVDATHVKKKKKEKEKEKEKEKNSG